MIILFLEEDHNEQKELRNIHRQVGEKVYIDFVR